MVKVKDESLIFDSIFSLIADTKINEDRPWTLNDIKQNLKDYSPNKLKSLESVLIDSLENLDKGKKDFREALENYEGKVMKLCEQIVELKIEKAKLGENITKYKVEILELRVRMPKHQATINTLSCEKYLIN